MISKVERSRQARAFGNTLRSLRIKRGFSGGGLSKRSGISRNMLCKWENGHDVPNLSVIIRLSEVLEVEAWNLVRNFERRLNETQPLPSMTALPEHMAAAIEKGGAQ